MPAFHIQVSEMHFLEGCLENYKAKAKIKRSKSKAKLKTFF